MKIEIGGFPILLFVVFLFLKLTSAISWSWWWVTSPLWIPVLLGIAGILIWFIFTLIAFTIAWLVSK